MPTGYTAKVQSGEITTLRDFALQCAWEFIACDEGEDVPIPDRFEPNTKFYDELEAGARKTLAELPQLSSEECTCRAQTAHVDALNEFKERARERGEDVARYDAMITKVEAWQVPLELTKLREFMLDQLHKSRRVDCNALDDAKPQLLSGEEWRNDTLTRAARDLAYAREKIQDEIQHTAERNAWLAALRHSLSEAK